MLIQLLLSGLTVALMIDTPGDSQKALDDTFQKFFGEIVDKTAGNISPLYQLDAFDWTILILYFTILGVLAVYGGYRVKQVIDFWRYRKFIPQPKGKFAEQDLPVITVQLPLFNEMYVVE